MEPAMSTRGGKYRIRTWLRGNLPGRLSDLFPKGRGDCGSHEWYRSDENTWRCYHCEAGVSERYPWDPLEGADVSLAALKSLEGSERRRDLSDAEEKLRLTLARDLLVIARELRSSGGGPAAADRAPGVSSR